MTGVICGLVDWFISGGWFDFIDEEDMFDVVFVPVDVEPGQTNREISMEIIN